jgi:hypothetical protein
MGGGSSRLEETDWEAATGKLTSSEETIDGAPPTSSYKVYHIVKTGMNQREFNVTDDESNLLFSTRAVQGSLAWFDVLGPQMDQYLLRVQVDLSRRYWVIYRFGAPAYAGQFADMTATTMLRQSRGERQPCLYKKACITVTWSRYHAIVNMYGPPPDTLEEEEEIESEEGIALPEWARMVVSTHFLAPPKPKETKYTAFTEVEVQQPAATDSEVEEANVPVVEKAKVDGKQVEEPTAPAVEDSNEPAVEETKEEPQGATYEEGVEANTPAVEEGMEANTPAVEEAKEEAVEKPHDAATYEEGIEEEKEDHKEDHMETLRDTPSLLEDPPTKTDPLATYATEEADKDFGPYRGFVHQEDDIPEHLRNPNLGPRVKKKKKSKLKEFSKWVKESTNETPIDPLEGYLQLKKPILKCEEINSFLGQHQTMLVGEKEAKELEREELATAAEMGGDAYNPQSNYSHSLDVEGTPVEDTATTEATVGEDTLGKATAADATIGKTTSGEATGDSKKKTKSFPNLRQFGTWLKHVGEAGSEWATATPPCNGLDPSTEKDQRRASDGADMDTSDQLMSSHGSVDGGVSVASSSKSNKPLEPLVGFWNWDNTMRVHKMKMHVAEGSDLALHVVLAIVTNQLRMERNVVVSTV